MTARETHCWLTVVTARAVALGVLSHNSGALVVVSLTYATVPSGRRAYAEMFPDIPAIGSARPRSFAMVSMRVWNPRATLIASVRSSIHFAWLIGRSIVDAVTLRIAPPATGCRQRSCGDGPSTRAQP